MRRRHDCGDGIGTEMASREAGNFDLRSAQSQSRVLLVGEGMLRLADWGILSFKPVVAVKLYRGVNSLSDVLILL